MKTADFLATWKCEKCGNVYSSSIEYCPNDGFSLQEGLINILLEQLKDVKITKIDQEFIDMGHNVLHYQPYDEGCITIHYIKSRN